MTDEHRVITFRVILQMLFFVVVVPFLPLLISRQWDWWEAWIYALVTILSFVVSRILVARVHPDLIGERARMLQHEDAAPWDKPLVILLGAGGASVMIVAGLDQLLAWSPAFGLFAKIVSLAAILAGYAIGSYALVENRFFSGMVRIQAERGHQVVSGGPYRWIRHPGYASAILTYLATPVLLDSPWAFLPAVFTTVIMIIRTSLEDKYLQRDLSGYIDYVTRVRYRLLPGLW